MIRKFKEQDLSGVLFREQELDYFGGHEEFTNMFDMLLKNCKTYTMIKNEEVVAFGFVRDTEEGACNCGIIPTQHIYKYPKSCFVELKGFIGKLAKKYDKIITESSDNPFLNKWHKLLGFKPKRYGTGLKNDPYLEWRF